MPKMRTHKSTSKRFRVTGKGKLRRTKIGKSHLRRKKKKYVLNMLDDMHVVSDKATKKRVQRLAPYLSKK